MLPRRAPKAGRASALPTQPYGCVMARPSHTASSPVMRLLGCAILALLHVPYTALADGGFEDAAWSANAYCESWVSGFTDDTESNRLSAVAHLTPKGAGEPVLTARWVARPPVRLPPQQVIRAAREAGARPCAATPTSPLPLRYCAAQPVSRRHSSISASS